MARKNRTARNRISSSNLFLMELIVALLIFSVSSAACVSIFMKAHQMSERASALGVATDQVSGAAELIRGCGSIGEIEETFREEYPEMTWGESSAEGTTYISLLSFLDKGGISCKEEDAKTLLSLEGALEGSMLKGSLVVRKTDGKGNLTGEVICELPFSHYIVDIHTASDVSGTEG